MNEIKNLELTIVRREYGKDEKVHKHNEFLHFCPIDCAELLRVQDLPNNIDRTT